MPHSKSKKAVKPKPKRIYKDKFGKSLGGKYPTLHTQYTGSRSGNIEHMIARDYASQRVQQFLSHFATSLKAYYDSLPGKSEIEIQVAILGDAHWLISSNKDSTTEHFYDSLVDQSVTSVVDVLGIYAGLARGKAKTSTANDSFRIRRHSTKLRKELTLKRHVSGSNILNSAISQLKAKGEDLCVKLDAWHSDANTIKDFCTGASGKKVALVTHTSYAAHAEQKILVALIRAGVHADTLVTFGGTFRPCRGCFESLSIVKKYYLKNLVFGSNPGHFWHTTDRCHIAILKLLRDHGKITEEQLRTDFDQFGVLKGLTTTSYRPTLRTNFLDGTIDDLHYASESDSDDSGSEDEDYDGFL